MWGVRRSASGRHWLWKGSSWPWRLLRRACLCLDPLQDFKNLLQRRVINIEIYDTYEGVMMHAYSWGLEIMSQPSYHAVQSRARVAGPARRSLNMEVYR